MKTIRLDEIKKVIYTFCDLPNSFMFRGHANAEWYLESTLERIIGSRWNNEIVKKFETYSLNVFQSKYHLYDNENVQPTSKLAWLSLMQHYGVPTRLLDFTSSPFVALYFAIESFNPQSENDIAIFAINYNKLMDESVEYIRKHDRNFTDTKNSISFNSDEIFNQTVDRFSYDIAWVTEPRQLNVRLDRQSGSFLLSGNKGKKINSILDSSIYKDCSFTKYVISGSLYQQLFALLRKMNLTSKTVYGDLHGLALSLKMEMAIYSLPE